MINMKKIWVITLFPDYFKPLLEFGITSQIFNGDRSQKVEFQTVYLGDHSPKSFKGCDSGPYGGGPGMVLRADVLESALVNGVVRVGGYNDLKSELHVIYTSPRGELFTNVISRELSDSSKDFVFICGRYEGVDERFLNQYVDQIISIGDFVLTGGELAVMSIIDSALRFKLGALGNDQSAGLDSFEDGLIEHPQYTRPRDFNGEGVPEILLSGDHKKIAEYNHNQKIEMTKKYRPDLYKLYKEKKR